ncbi:hypothetical protein [Oricola cellulosilytica]|uniref:Chemotaxis protein MotC n=1 Tax=Oricola cellulosilytica TaxID=1429082 RepID=A0A4R0PF18_9HYPH|nr:hypothetical protein [Oricola cellulosilytica]TCD16211.1 hypothetical protein E0D97_01905 [Oricola cellulosilytica]
MTRAAVAVLAAGFAFGPVAVTAPSAEQVPAAPPYKLMRSLQILQDQIAYGDKAAHAMQLRLTKLVDEGFRSLDRTQKMSERDARALLSYSMVGGNPETLEELLHSIGERDDELVRLALAVLIFQKGAAKTAASRLQNVDPERAGGLFGASLALVRGLVTEDDGEARVDFDTARVLAPGTLIEEAALRRLMTIHKRRQDPVSFLRVASRYARRYIGSPYALQFAEEFIAGVVAMDGWMDRAVLKEVLDFMPPQYREAIMLRLMRAATVDGKIDLVDHIAASRRQENPASATPVRDDNLRDERRALYEKIAKITSKNVREVAGELSAVDEEALSEGDRELLRAVLAVAGMLTDRDAVIPPPRYVPPGAKLLPTESESIFTSAERDPGPLMQDFDGFVSGTRDALNDIDSLLEEIQ